MVLDWQLRCGHSPLRQSRRLRANAFGLRHLKLANGADDYRRFTSIAAAWSSASARTPALWQVIGQQVAAGARGLHDAPT